MTFLYQLLTTTNALTRGIPVIKSTEEPATSGQKRAREENGASEHAAKKVDVKEG